MLNNVKKGDLVVRKSHNKDITFIVDIIINNHIAILNGITTRLQADSYLNDLVVLDKKEIKEVYDTINLNIDKKLSKMQISKDKELKRNNSVIYTGRILHLDGDRRYSEKSKIYYNKIGLKAIVKNISESRQASIVELLINRYNPDILVITRS